jgi:hypothetical protein
MPLETLPEPRNPSARRPWRARSGYGQAGGHLVDAVQRWMPSTIRAPRALVSGDSQVTTMSYSPVMTSDCIPCTSRIPGPAPENGLVRR